MKKIGIIGGIGWPSTIEYYRLICEASQQFHQDKMFSGPVPMPEIVIESLNINYTVNNRGSSEPGSWLKWDQYFKAALKRLENSGAQLILLASVTPHARLKQISEDIETLIVSVYQSLGQYCTSQDIQNLLVLGTLPTMTSPAFKEGMEPFGIRAYSPASDELKADTVKVIEALYQNKPEGASSEIDRIVRASIPDDQLATTAVCLGCTELPIAFHPMNNQPGFKQAGIRYINSSVIHAASAFQLCVADCDT